MALIRTDYGLIYNTDGSLCATLLPEGGVAVTEGTTNLVTDQSFWSTRTGAIVTRELVTSGQWAGWYKVHVTRTGTGAFGYIGNTQLISVAIDSTHTWSIDFYSETGKVKPRLDGTFGIEDLSRVDERRWALTWTNNRGSGGIQGIYFHHSDGAEIDVDEVFYYRWYQVEAQPYPTPFVEGTRPTGKLSYDLPISINGDWTIAKWLELDPYYMDKSYSGDNAIGMYRLPLIEIGSRYYATGYGVLGVYGAWTGSQPGKTIRIMANKDQVITYSSSPDTITLTEAEYNNKILAVLTKSGSMLTAYIYTVENKYVLTCNIASLGDISQIAPQLNYHTIATSSEMYCKRHLNTLVCPYAVSPETVATWHSLGAPFFDPREQIDAGARPINAPGVIIDSTGAWGISGGVKQAGFGTDGRWVAGGGKVVSDAQGLRTYDKPYTDPAAVKQVEIGTDGALIFGGGAGRADSEGMILYDITDPDNPKPMIRFIGKTGSADFEGVVKAKTLVVPVGTNRWG